MFVLIPTIFHAMKSLIDLPKCPPNLPHFHVNYEKKINAGNKLENLFASSRKTTRQFRFFCQHNCTITNPLIFFVLFDYKNLQHLFII